MSGQRKQRVLRGTVPRSEWLGFEQLSRVELERAIRRVLAERVHGLSFSAYLAGQGPDLQTQLSQAQIRARLSLIASSTRWVRTFSCTDGNEHSPALAKALGLKTLVGAWLGSDEATNERELQGLMSLGRAGHVDLAAVGNEVLLREELSEDALLAAIARVRAALPGVPVATVDAYYPFVEHPRLVEACDVLLINCYPFWEEYALEESLAAMKEMVAQVRAVAGGKRIVITETGWPSAGTPVGAAVPSVENALRYALATFEWTAAEGLELFYFSAFDEAWKHGAEGGCGPHWGFWDQEGNHKYGDR